MMESTFTLIPCPEPGCAMPFEIEDRWVAKSTDVPVEMVKGRCVDGHQFNMPSAMNDRKGGA